MKYLLFKEELREEFLSDLSISKNCICPRQLHFFKSFKDAMSFANDFSPLFLAYRKLKTEFATGLFDRCFFPDTTLSLAFFFFLFYS